MLHKDVIKNVWQWKIAYVLHVFVNTLCYVNFPYHFPHSVSSVYGIIATARIPSFELLLWRCCCGFSFLHHEELPQTLVTSQTVSRAYGAVFYGEFLRQINCLQVDDYCGQCGWEKLVFLKPTLFCPMHISLSPSPSLSLSPGEASEAFCFHDFILGWTNRGKGSKNLPMVLYVAQFFISLQSLSLFFVIVYLYFSFCLLINLAIFTRH